MKVTVPMIKMFYGPPKANFITASFLQPLGLFDWALILPLAATLINGFELKAVLLESVTMYILVAVHEAGRVAHVGMYGYSTYDVEAS